MNSAAEGIELLEFGHSKDGDFEYPQVNVSIAFDQIKWDFMKKLRLAKP